MHIVNKFPIYIYSLCANEFMRLLPSFDMLRSNTRSQIGQLQVYAALMKSDQDARLRVLREIYVLEHQIGELVAREFLAARELEGQPKGVPQGTNFMSINIAYSAKLKSLLLNQAKMFEEAAKINRNEAEQDAAVYTLFKQRISAKLRKKGL